jgi:hypothetical protein
MTRSTFRFAALLGLLCLVVPVGCGKRATTNISILNSSTTSVRVNAWHASEVDPQGSDAQWPETERIVEAGADTTFALARVDPSKDEAVVVRIVPLSGDSDDPYWIQLEPPAPFILRVRGAGSNLAMSREEINLDESARGPGGIPQAPGERRYRGSLPPWVAR